MGLTTDTRRAIIWVIKRAISNNQKGINMTKSDVYEAIGAMLNEAQRIEDMAIKKLEDGKTAREAEIGLAAIDKARGLRQAAMILIEKQVKAEAAIDAKYLGTGI